MRWGQTVTTDPRARWWRIVLSDGSVWAESSDEEEIRRILAEYREDESAGRSARLLRLWEWTLSRWEEIPEDDGKREGDDDMTDGQDTPKVWVDEIKQWKEAPPSTEGRDPALVGLAKPTDICEGSGVTVYPSSRRDFSGRVWCGLCEQFVPTVNVSDPYRPERRDAHITMRERVLAEAVDLGELTTELVRAASWTAYELGESLSQMAWDRAQYDTQRSSLGVAEMVPRAGMVEALQEAYRLARELAELRDTFEARAPREYVREQVADALNAGARALEAIEAREGEL